MGTTLEVNDQSHSTEEGVPLIKAIRLGQKGNEKPLSKILVAVESY